MTSRGEHTFRTVVPVRRSTRLVGLTDTILSLGSCFAENIGGRLASSRFTICRNPAGALYNPLSVSALLRRLLAGRPFGRQDIFEHDGLWHSFSHHGDFSGVSPDETLAAMNTSFSRARDRLPQLDCLIVTFGSAFAYLLRESGAVAANCHKLPADLFERRMLTVEEITTEWIGILDALIETRPQLNIIMTVSPVRHLRDDPHENSISKATLMVAVHELEKRFPSLHYFPAYEIVLDELRDYRFFGPDMAHPNEAAVDYVWQRFVESCVDGPAAAFIEEYSVVAQARRHEVQKPGTPAARRFAEKVLAVIAGLESQYPDVDLKDDRSYFLSLIPA